MGGIFAGGITTGIYPTDTPEQVIFKARHSGAVIAVCESSAKAQVFVDAAAAGKLPELRACVVWDPEEVAETRTVGNITVCHWNALAELAKETSEETLAARMDAQQPGSVCCLIYTSGTTGNPKAVMISHDSITYEAVVATTMMDGIGTTAEEERLLSYLPLTHVAGMLVDIIMPLVFTAQTKCWVSVGFARPYDLKLGSIAMRLNAIKPTVFLGVPRVWEKIAEKMKAVGASTKGLKKKIATFAKAKGLEHSMNCQIGGSGEYPPYYGVADKIVLSKIAEKLGLDKLKFGLTGAAPISAETLKYFGALGIDINEVYGMSECSGACSGSSNSAHLWGSCGFELGGIEIKAFKIDGKSKVECPLAVNFDSPTEEEQGELCYRGRNNMVGYLANPDLGQAHVDEITKKNMDAIDDEGWLHSGDKGAICTRGFVRITGRYKELIIGAGGENIAPVPIEDAVKEYCPAISNIMMLGDKMKFNICFVTLKAKGATGEKPGTDELDGAALKLVPGVTTVSEAMGNETFIKTITKAITAANKNGKVCPSNAAKIQKFCILPSDFSVETGELTPTLKLKRSVVQTQHAALITKIYASKDVCVPFSS